MEIISLRDPTWGDSTAAYVMVDGVFECHSIEDPVREPATGRPAGDFKALDKWVRSWKIPAKTAIPTGRYRTVIDWSNKFRKLMIHMLDVPGFDGIRAHGGATPDHSEGCAILGDELYQLTVGWRVREGRSKPAVDRLFKKIEAEIFKGAEVWWTFKSKPITEEGRT